MGFSTLSSASERDEFISATGTVMPKSSLEELERGIPSELMEIPAMETPREMGEEAAENSRRASNMSTNQNRGLYSKPEQMASLGLSPAAVNAKEILQISQLQTMLGKKLVTAQKRGETRALCLGLGMVACSMMMYFFIGITIVPFYTKSVWTAETMCKVLKANINDKVLCPNSEGPKDEDIFPYPCLQVWVNLTASGQEVMLYHTEDTLERNPKCSYVPDKLEDSKEVKARIEKIASNFKKYQTFPCYYDPGGMQTNVILSRLYPPKGLLFAFLWPTLMFTGGCLIIVLVKISQYFSVLSAWQ